MSKRARYAVEIVIAVLFLLVVAPIVRNASLTAGGYTPTVRAGERFIVSNAANDQKSADDAIRHIQQHQSRNR